MSYMNNQQDENYSYYSQKAIQGYYLEIEDDVKRKFKQLSTDTLEQIKTNMKRHHNKISQEQNLNLITLQRTKLIQEMAQHVKKCLHPECNQVKQVILFYGFSKQQKHEDPVSYICNQFISGLGYKNSECAYASYLNDKMFETHRIVRGL